MHFPFAVNYADSLVCQGLDKLEEKVPAIKKSPGEVSCLTQFSSAGSSSATDADPLHPFSVEIRRLGKAGRSERLRDILSGHC